MASSAGTAVAEIVYDAYFLALALDLGNPVWTFDTRFRDPVDASGYQASVLLIGRDVVP